jgi:hypothetical protein
MSALVTRNILLTFSHGMGNGPGLNDIVDIFKPHFSTCTAEEIKNDISGLPPIELSRKRINLRNGSSSSGKLSFGTVVKVKLLKNSPEMLLENIMSETDPKTNTTREVAQCSWFNNGVIQRVLFDARHVEEVEIVEPKKHSSVMQDVAMFGYSMNKLALKDPSIVADISAGRKINAIKTVRAHTGLGLKESKDMVEAVTQYMITNWNQGYFE